MPHVGALWPLHGHFDIHIKDTLGKKAIALPLPAIVALLVLRMCPSAVFATHLYCRQNKEVSSGDRSLHRVCDR